jgi:hypothetical protein
MVGRVVDLLNKLGRFKSGLGVIARAKALAPALEYEHVRDLRCQGRQDLCRSLEHEDVRGLMKEKLGIDVFVKASEVLEELNDMRERVQELMRDEEFMSYIKSWSVKADEEAVKIVIFEAASLLKHALAIYRLDNNEFVEARDLLNEAAKERGKIGDYESYLVASSLALRAEAIEGSLVGGKLVDGFRQLYEEAFNEAYKRRFSVPTAMRYLSIASRTLGNYLVSLALTGNYEMINELLEEYLHVLEVNRRASVLTRLMLNALLGPRGGLSGELEGKLSVNPEELIDAFESDIDSKYLPALRVAFNKMISPEVGIKLCEGFNDEDCVNSVLAVKGDSATVKQLREGVINAFNNSLKGLSFDAEPLINEFKGLVSGLDGKSLVQLIAPSNSMARLALMLHALTNGNKELAKALALDGAIYSSSKLLRRLFLEAYRACCDLESESFRLAIARLFFYHI